MIFFPFLKVITQHYLLKGALEEIVFEQYTAFGTIRCIKVGFSNFLM